LINSYVCPTELYAFADSHEKFEKLGAQVIGVSIDSHFTHLAWRNTPRKEGGLGQLSIPLVADHAKTVSKAFGVLVNDPNDGLYGAALRGLFIIDEKNVVRSVTVNDAPGELFQL
jgi:peroxiredoxin (alkyl hydroperoxide reductase subunit C)